MSRFGLSTGGTVQNLGAADLARYFDGAQAAHAGWVRVDINWDMIQWNGASTYNWAPFDSVVNAARIRGINVLGTILYTPPWARMPGYSWNAPPSDLNAYATFARTAVTHFSALGVHAYEVWNEPNISAFWASGPDPARYTQMLKLAYPAIKSADPSAVVISAGLSPYGVYGEVTSANVNPLNFLQGMYTNGARGSFDAVGWHPYNFSTISYQVWSAWSQMSATTPSARSIMVSAGDGEKKLWPTEFGAPTGTGANAASEATQARIVTDSYSALKAWSWAGPAFLYSYRDVGTNLTNLEDNFGIIHNDWTPKPAYGAYQAVAGAG